MASDNDVGNAMDQVAAKDSLRSGLLPECAALTNFVVGIDIANRVFQVHASAPGGTAARLKITRDEVVAYARRLPAGCTIAMEACSSSHHWARVLRDLGHEARLIPAQHVKPFVQSNKNDRADALAIWEAAQRPGVHFVPVKTKDEQAVMLLHTHRAYLILQRIQATNRLRAAFREYGIVFNGSWKACVKAAPGALKEVAPPQGARDVIADLLKQIDDLKTSIVAVETRLRCWAASDDLADRFMTIPGVGLITATALAASLGDGGSFASARDFSAAIGLVPSHSGTGGTTRIGRLSRRGNRYLKTLLVQAAFRRIIKRSVGEAPWLDALLARKKALVAAIAIANKLARVMWAIAARGSAYDEAVWQDPSRLQPHN